MADIPHLAFPVRFVNGRAAVVEQDSIEHVAQCVETLLRYRPGDRPEQPDFGTPDPTFEMAPLDLERIRAAVLEYEPRATLLADQSQNGLDTLIRLVVGGGYDG